MPSKEDLKLGKVAQPLRAALTGRTTSPGVFDVLEVLGKEECLNAIEGREAYRLAVNFIGLFDYGVT